MNISLNLEACCFKKQKKTTNFRQVEYLNQEIDMSYQFMLVQTGTK
jgi:hypothetical protein